MEDNFEKERNDSANLMKLLEDSDKRYEYVRRSLEGTKMRNRQLSISLNKEKEDRLKIKMALNVAREKADENRISLNRNVERVSLLEGEVEELTQARKELLELLESEKERNKLLQNELELYQETETATSGISAEDVADLTNVDQVEGENILQNMVVKLRKKLDRKETECNELEDKLFVMRQELVRQGDQLVRAGAEFEQQLSRLHEVLSKERHLNSLLSEEGDETVKELQIQLQEKNELNTELQDIHDKASERMVCIEEQCHYYRTRLKETEKRLNVIYQEYEQSTKPKETVSCQVCECELASLDEDSPSSLQHERVQRVFEELWRKDKDHEEQTGNSISYKMNIIKLLQNGFKHLGGNIKMDKSVR